jgi:hypothetical protein
VAASSFRLFSTCEATTHIKLFAQQLMHEKPGLPLVMQYPCISTAKMPLQWGNDSIHSPLNTLSSPHVRPRVRKVKCTCDLRDSLMRRFTRLLPAKSCPPTLFGTRCTSVGSFVMCNCTFCYYGHTQSITITTSGDVGELQGPSKTSSVRDPSVYNPQVNTV